jgi:hypothetical protein
MANIYRVYNGVCNDIYKYDFMLKNERQHYDQKKKNKQRTLKHYTEN